MLPSSGYTTKIAQCAFAVGLWDVDGVSDVPGPPSPPPPAPAPPDAWAPLAEWWTALPRRKRILAVSLAAIVVLLSFVPGILWNRCGVGGCPNVQRLTAYQPGGAPRLLDRNGQVFATLAPVEGQVVRLDAVPRPVQQAFVAVEDQRFLEDHGGDWRRVWGAVGGSLGARASGPASGRCRASCWKCGRPVRSRTSSASRRSSSCT